MNEGVIAVIVGAAALAGVLLGARIQLRKEARITAVAPGGRELWVPASLLALSVAFVGLVMGILLEPLRRWAEREHLFLRLPVEELRITQRANGSAVTRWRPSRGFAGADLHMATVPGRGKDGALGLTVDLLGPGDAVAVQMPGRYLPDGVAVATVWVYVEDSEAAKDAGLHARLVGRMNAGSNGSFSLVGDRAPLRPGAWTQVVWTGSYLLELSPALGDDSIEKKVSASERLTYLGVRLDALGHDLVGLNSAAVSRLRLRG